MKLHTLQALVAAVEEGSLRGAAKRLGVSQPALTKAIRDLELELGASLLVRTTQGVVPSAQGMVLHEHALRVTRELTSASDKIKQLSGRMTGQLSVGAVPLAVMLLLHEWLLAVCLDESSSPSSALSVTFQLLGREVMIDIEDARPERPPWQTVNQQIIDLALHTIAATVTTWEEQTSRRIRIRFSPRAAPA